MNRAWLPALLVISFAGKVTLRLALAGPDYWRTGYAFYVDMAENFLRTGSLFLGDADSLAGRYHAYRPPLYPLFIAAIHQALGRSVAAFVVAQALISTLTVYLVYVITRRIAGARAALLSALVYAFFPYAFYHDTQIQETALYSCLSVASIACLVAALDEKRTGAAFAGGLLAGAAVLTRMSHLCVVAFTLAAVVLVLRRRREEAAGFTLAFLLGLSVFLIPWIAHNRIVTGHAVLTSETGFALARAHNRHTFRYYPYRASIDESWVAFHESMGDEDRNALARVANDEFAASLWYRGKALDYVREHPFATLAEGGYKVAVNFLGILSPLHGPFKNASYAFSFWLLSALALCGLSRLGTSYSAVLAATVLAHSAVSFVFWAHTSHRAFLDPLFAVPAGIGLAELLCSLRRAEAVRA